MRRQVIIGVFVVALAAGGAVFRPVEPATEVRALTAPAASVSDTGTAEAKPADQVRGERLLRQAGVWLRDAYSVRMAADVRQGTKHVRAEVRLDHHGNCSGTIDDGDGVVAHVVYLKGGADTDGDGEGDGKDEAYLKYTDAALAAIEVKAEAMSPEMGARVRAFTARARGKYIKAPSGPKGAQALGKQCGVGQMLATAMTRRPEGTRTLPVVTRDGERLIPLVLPSASGGGTAYLVADGDPRLRSVSGTSGGMRTAVTFTDYDKPFSVPRIDPAQVVEAPANGGALFEV
ncbi:hypothetical protein OKJ48_00475 [Streptomyces kunmingensis]|uniref:Lipoprotein n=1 Tax=Streptomyces kunmingensis TaxID=68225 RepID=A0ABU6C1Z7_9ACTN|nr:hypothetical protein [Streptomyces kunmingensis]MEB3958739.1 hypothetical protein [Streptomyces kunmingensis]